MWWWMWCVVHVTTPLEEQWRRGVAVRTDNGIFKKVPGIHLPVACTLHLPGQGRNIYTPDEERELECRAVKHVQAASRDPFRHYNVSAAIHTLLYLP